MEAVPAYTRKPYPSDLTDEEWTFIAPYVPAAQAGGRPEDQPKREILNGIFSVLRSGCAWRMLPHDFPPLAERLSLFSSVAAGRHVAGEARFAARRCPGCCGPAPPAQRGEYREPVRQDHRKRGVRGYDAHKHVKGRKRHLFVDT